MSPPLDDETHGWHNATYSADDDAERISGNIAPADDDDDIDANSNIDSDLSNIEIDETPYIDFDDDMDHGLDDMSMCSTYDVQESHESVSDDLMAFQASEAAKFKAGSSNGQNLSPAQDNREIVKAANKEEMNAKTAMDMLELRKLATDSKDGLLRQWASTLFDIFDQYQHHSANMDPQNVAHQHGIDFGDYKGLCIATLLQVLQLLPEAYQKHILAADDERAQQTHKSWLYEHIIDVVIRLSCLLHSQEIIFGRKLCAGLSESLDALYRTHHSMCFLEYQMQKQIAQIRMRGIHGECTRFR